MARREPGYWPLDRRNSGARRASMAALGRPWRQANTAETHGASAGAHLHLREGCPAGLVVSQGILEQRAGQLLFGVPVQAKFAGQASRSMKWGWAQPADTPQHGRGVGRVGRDIVPRPREKRAEPRLGRRRSEPARRSERDRQLFQKRLSSSQPLPSQTRPPLSMLSAGVQYAQRPARRARL